METKRSKRYRRPSPPVVQPDHSIGVTVLTQKSLDRAAQVREPDFFNDAKLGELTRYVEEYRGRWPDDLVIIIAEITGKLPPNSDFPRQLRELADGRFPRHIIDSVVKKRIRQPFVPGDAGGFYGNAAWVLKYRGGTRVFHDDPEPGPQADTDPTWIGAWVGSSTAASAKKASGEKLHPPMAVIIISQNPSCPSSDLNFYGRSMFDQYKRNETSYRWRFVCNQPLFLFMDLDRLFNNFKVNVATMDLKIRYMETSPYDRRHEVIPRVKRLRDVLLRLAEFRQEFKTHAIAQKSMEKIVERFVDLGARPMRLSPTESLCDRLYDLGNELETVNLEVEMLREQCIYLMDSEFNTVAARTDARLGILTILAFVLTPAGFVVSLFSVIDSGTTQLIVSTIVVAFFSVVVYVVVDKLYRWAERKQLPSDLAALGRDHLHGDGKRQRYL